ncbi:MAG: sugar ABC transporter ATP-binding protein [bacterium]|nr:sugar ABC transporter ATP-binding protein [bacterium]
MNDRAVLELRGVVKDYPGIRALDQVDMTFAKGEIHGILGENGAGKSTLIKILAGVVSADAGTIFFHGNQKKIASGRDARQSGLSFIHQELNLISFFNAPENIFLGHPYPKTPWGTVSWKTLHKKTRGILERLQLDIPLNVPVKHLTPGERAMVAIARAFAESASIYCMDEPTTSLTEHEKQTLFSAIRNLKSLGATILYVSHDLDDAIELTDQVTIMRDSKVVGTWETETISKDEIVSTMIGRDITPACPQKTATTEDLVLSASGISSDRVKDISFDLHAGEILGIAGLLGSGRTEVFRLLYGIDPIRQGSLKFRKSEFRPTSPKDSIRRGIVLVPEERRSQGLLLQRSIYENIGLIHLDKLSNGPFLNRLVERRESEEIGRSVKLKTADYQYQVNTLSGGNQQKVVFAKSLLRQPSVLMLDEPTKGVDVGARFEIYSIVREMAERGTAVLLVSSDVSEMLGLADRILIMCEGRQIRIVDKQNLDRETLLHHCYGTENRSQ